MEVWCEAWNGHVLLQGQHEPIRRTMGRRQLDPRPMDLARRDNIRRQFCCQQAKGRGQVHLLRDQECSPWLLGRWRMAIRAACFHNQGLKVVEASFSECSNILTVSGTLISFRVFSPISRVMASRGPPYPWEPPVHLRPPLIGPKRFEVLLARYGCACMWFWLLYRFKEDGDVLVGRRYSWEHRGEKHNVFPRTVEELAARFAPETSAAAAEN